MYIAPSESLKVFYGITNCLPPSPRTDHFVLFPRSHLEGVGAGSIRPTGHHSYRCDSLKLVAHSFTKEQKGIISGMKLAHSTLVESS